MSDTTVTITSETLEYMADRIEKLEAERDGYAHKLMQANDTYTEMHLEIELLKINLAKAMGLLEAWINVATHCTIEEGVCCCGDDMDTHAEPMDCGHEPVDHGTYIAMGLAEKTEATLAELTGGGDE